MQINCHRKINLLRDNWLVCYGAIQSIVAYRIHELPDMTDIERAMKAYQKMDDEHRKILVPVLVALAVSRPRKPVLRLVINNRR
jgi:hypothetical protein